MISIENLVFKYPRSDFQLCIEKLDIAVGSKVAVVGPSGSGKTTLLNLISGISTPQSGSVLVNDLRVSDLSDSYRRNFRIANIGMVFQQFELVDYLNLIDNVLLPFLVNRTLNGRMPSRKAAIELANKMGLGSKLKRFPDQLSQGEQQRVAICRALITNPPLILADEPTGNLDPDNKGKILELLFDSCDRNGQALVVVTHDMNILDGFDDVVDFERFRQGIEV